MPIRLNYDAARRRFAEALELARSDAPLSPKWIALAASVNESPSKTFVAMLGTALLAKATDTRVDPSSLKAREFSRGYSARNLCKVVLVPCAIDARISLGLTGREPLNNHPFYSNDRVSSEMNVSDSIRPHLDVLCGALATADGLSAEGSLEALAAFLRFRISSGPELAPSLGGSLLGASELLETAARFIRENPEGGKRGQAFLAACLSLAFDGVSTSRINDPSRHIPGDAAVEEDGGTTLAAEAKQRTASSTEILQFVARCRDAGVSRAMVAAMNQSHVPLDVEELQRLAWNDYGVHLSVFQTAEDLLRSALNWTSKPLEQALGEFPELMAGRLEELEVSAEGRRAWADFFPENSE